MRYFILIFFFVFTLFKTQVTRVYYELTYKPSKDSLFFEKELDIIETNSKLSIYQNYESFKIDSIISKNKTSPNNVDPIIFTKKINNNFKIIKNNDNEITYKEILGGRESYSYDENVNIKWKLTNNSKIENNETLMSAECYYGGRLWKAWYNPKIPIYDGPYKFGSLPGLIYRIEDSNMEYSWVLVGLKNCSAFTLDKMNFMEIQGFKSTLLRKKEFLLLKKNFEKSPLGNAKESLGDMMNSSEMIQKMKEYEKRELDFIKRHNNTIELK